MRALVPRSEPVSGMVAVVVGRLSDEGGTRAGQPLELRQRAIGPVALGLASRRPWRWDSPQGFQHGENREDVEGTEQSADCASREALWFLTPWPSVALPVFSVLKAFLDCGRHMFPRLSEARRIQAIALGTRAWRRLYACLLELFTEAGPGTIIRA